MAIVSPTRLKTRLLDQWVRSPLVRELIYKALEMSEEQVLAFEEGFHRGQNVDLAEGVWLDWLGLRLGIPRPWLVVSDTDVFSVRGPGRGFDQAPIQSARLPLRNTFPIEDPLYRKLIKARRVAIFTMGTLVEFTHSVRQIDPDATVAETGTMQVTVSVSNTRFIEELKLADKHRALARTAGVQMILK